LTPGNFLEVFTIFSLRLGDFIDHLHFRNAEKPEDEAGDYDLAVAASEVNVVHSSVTGS
jgi:hypothetical protein